MNRNRILAIIAIVLLLTTSVTLYYLKDSSLTELKMTLLSERVQEVNYDETAEYEINVKNVGEDSKNFHLQLTDVPEHWHASLDKRDLALSGGSQETVTLTVTAPSREIVRTRGVARVAEIGVRGGNVTIGTITILKGSATLTRDGEESVLNSGDEIRSGDIVSTTGELVIAIDPNKLINASKTYTGNIYVLLSDAVVGFLRYQDTAYMMVISGEATIWVPGGGGGGRGRAPSQSPVINLSEMNLIDMEFPSLEYNVVMEFGSLEESSFFHLDVSEEETTVEVFDGEVTLGTEVSTRSLKKFEQTTAVRTIEVPEPRPVERTIITLDSGDSVEGNVKANGTNILDLDDVYYFPVGKKEYYVAPLLPEISIDLSGMADGEYEIDLSQVGNYSSKTFTIRSTGSVRTTDILVYTGESLKLKNMEKDKTYNLTIGYEDVRTGKKSEFELVKVRSSEKEQSIAVDDWENLDEKEEKPVKFKEGDKEVPISTGTSGEKIDELLEEEEKEFPIVVTALSVIIVLLIVILFTMSYWYPLLERREKAQKDQQGLEDSGKDEVCEK